VSIFIFASFVGVAAYGAHGAEIRARISDAERIFDVGAFEVEEGALWQIIVSDILDVGDCKYSSSSTISAGNLRLGLESET